MYLLYSDVAFRHLFAEMFQFIYILENIATGLKLTEIYRIRGQLFIVPTIKLNLIFNRKYFYT